MPDPADTETLAEVLRGCGFWATHSDRWNDKAWQDELWSTLARAVVSSEWFAARIVQARAGEADVVIAAQAEAWDEGVTKASPYGGGYLRSLLIENPYRADRLATDTAAPEGVLSEEYAENLIGFVRTFETGEAAASALPIFLRTATRPAAPVAVEGVETVADCGQCFACVGDKPAYEGTWLTVGMTRMIVCAQCGNKRCPHSTDHRNDCTGSNEPGQVGSRYGEWSPVEPETSEPEGGAR